MVVFQRKTSSSRKLFIGTLTEVMQTAIPIARAEFPHGGKAILTAFLAFFANYDSI